MFFNVIFVHFLLDDFKIQFINTIMKKIYRYVYLTNMLNKDWRLYEHKRFYGLTKIAGHSRTAFQMLPVLQLLQVDNNGEYITEGSNFTVFV